MSKEKASKKVLGKTLSGLLSPPKSENGYRYYTEEDMACLQTILFYKYLGFPLKKIKSLIAKDNTELLTHLKRQLNLMQKEKEKLLTLMETLKKTIDYEERKITMSIKEKFSGFVYQDNQKYEEMAITKQEKAEQWRKAWADITNKYLEENSIQEKIDHRSYQRQGIEQIPTIHLGVSATQMEKKGIATDRGNINREIKHQNKILKEISRRIKALLNWIRGIGKEEKAEIENIKSTLPPKENLLSVFENLIRKNADNHNTDLEQYIESYQFLKEKNIISLSELKENIVTLRDKNYKTTRTIKDTEKKIDDRVQLINHAEKYLKHKDTYKAYTKLKKNKQDTFYNEHTAEIILFESAKKYLKEHLGENKTLNISKWKSEIGTLRKEKDTLYSQMIDIRKKVEQAESVRSCIDKLLQEKRGLTQVKKQELGL